MNVDSRRRRFLLAASVLVLLAGAIIALILVLQPRRLPEPWTPRYQEYLRAFQVGVAALDATRDDLARTKLESAVELIPDEPAGWANLGLLELRQNNLEQAAKSLKRAQDQAPASGEIEALLGLLAEKQGRLPEA